MTRPAVWYIRVKSHKGGHIMGLKPYFSVRKGIDQSGKSIENMFNQNLWKRFVLTNSSPVIGTKAYDEGAVAQLSECGLQHCVPYISGNKLI